MGLTKPISTVCLSHETISFLLTGSRYWVHIETSNSLYSFSGDRACSLHKHEFTTFTCLQQSNEEGTNPWSHPRLHRAMCSVRATGNFKIVKITCIFFHRSLLHVFLHKECMHTNISINSLEP